MAEDLKINITADVKDFNAELVSAQNQLRKFQAELKGSTDPSAITTIQAKIVDLKTKIDSLQSTNKNFVRGTNEARFALNDLSRVAQDAPYGFIGISNNINPLIDSFARLKGSTTSTTELFAALGSELAGIGGLGLAVGVITSAITLLDIGLTRWTGSSKEAAVASKQLSDIAKQQSDIFDKLKLSIQSTNSEIDFLSKIKTLDFNIANTNSFARSINEAKNNLQAFIDKRDASLEATKSISQKLIETEREIYKYADQTNQSLAGIDISRSDSDISDYDKTLQSLINTFRNLDKEFDKNNKSTGEYVDNIELARRQIKVLEIDEKTRAQKTGDSITELLAKFRRSLISIDELFGFPVEANLKKKIDAFNQIINKLIVDKKLNPSNKIIIGLETELSELKLKEANLKLNQWFKKSNLELQPPEMSEFDKAMEDEAKRVKDYFGFKTTNALPGKAPEIPTDMWVKGKTTKIDIPKQIQDLGVKMTEFFSNLGTSSVDAFASAIAEGGKFSTIAGNFFDGLFASLGKNLEELGKYMVEAGIKLLIIKKAMFANPAFAIVGGIALAALGAMISANMAKRQAFAIGTNNAPGGMAMVGERGPEMISLPKGSKVVPAAQTSSMMGATQSVEVYGVLKGQDIYFSNKKYGQTYGRTA